MGIVKLLKNSVVIVFGFLLIYSAISVWPDESRKDINPEFTALQTSSDPHHQFLKNPQVLNTPGAIENPTGKTALENRGSDGIHIISRQSVQNRQFMPVSRIIPESGIPGSMVTIFCPGIMPDDDAQVFMNGESVRVNTLESGQVSVLLPGGMYGLVHVEVVTENTYYQSLSGLNILRPQPSSPYFAHPEVVTRSAVNLDRIWSFDMDLDGDTDIFTTSQSSGYLAWLENLDDRGTYGPPIVVHDGADSLITVGIQDMDDDGDRDIYAVLASTSQFVWFENVDGIGRFTAPRTIPAINQPVHWAACADLDGDGKTDVLTAGAGSQGGYLTWYKNRDGRGNFSEAQPIAHSPDPFLWVTVGDLNHNGDIDVLAACSGENEISWFVNLNGAARFSSAQVITNMVAGPTTAVATDLNGDKFVDVLSVSSQDSKIAWYRNRDGRGVFGNQVTISTTVTGAEAVSAADLDADGDLDVLSSSTTDGRIVWFENAGGGEFLTENTITNDNARARYVQAADVDSDGDLDILAVAFTGDEILLFRQLSPFVGNNVRSAIPREFRLHQNYPNPFNPRTTIRYSLPEASEVELVVMNAVGQVVNTLVHEYQQAGFKSVVWDGRDENGKSLGSGVYFYRIKAGFYRESRRMILIR
ncbi:MAG: FG-GAP-like repeat-containing protein [Lentisphaeria bacterium]|nr:FG-GAP-like repeat-containing protein [Candidatus Neomarinimicrobiota bacterium]MCF7842207.1 FG-GAP-like repeat-containing protein [Lentisphaeria bacterium]